MLIAVVITLLNKQILSYQWIIVGIVTGSIVGGYISQRGCNDSNARNDCIIKWFWGIS